MLRFKLHQIHVPSLGRYFLPLPKLTDLQLGFLSSNLEQRGFSVCPGSGPSRRVARKGAQRIAIDGALGLAGSGGDVLDALAPPIPQVLALGRRSAEGANATVTASYLSLKRAGPSTRLHLFPRLESFRTWSALRKDGLCGLTPDEAVVLKRILTNAPRSSQLECVTAKPRQGSKALQEGRRLYYRSTIPIAEFLDSLGTIDSEGAEAASYLPRDSIISLSGVRIDLRVETGELGEWCFTG